MLPAGLGAVRVDLNKHLEGWVSIHMDLKKSDSLKLDTLIHAVAGDRPNPEDGKTSLYITRLPTPFCPMTACASNQGVCLLEFTDNQRIVRELQDLVKRLDAVIRPEPNPHLVQLETELAAYFAGQLRAFTVSLHTPGTAFQQAAWKILRDIPYGETRSYQQQAIALGNPKAVRAVAAANGQNRVSIVIPCHRVIGSDGSLTGYGGGLDRKKWLLDFEKARGVQISLFDD